MRKINSVLSIVIIVLFLLHMIMGSLLLLGIIPYIGAIMGTLPHLLGTAIFAHIIIGAKLGIDTLYAMKKSGVGYFSENKLFWVRRISGGAVLLFMILHASLFVRISHSGEYYPKLFDLPQLICSILFFISLMLHIASNIRPLVIALGAGKAETKIGSAAVILAILLLFAAVAFIYYFVRCQL